MFQAAVPPTASGPQDIRGEEALDLLISWICGRDNDVDWDDILRRAPRRMLYRIGFALLHLRRPGRRLHGIKRRRHASQRYGELPWAFGAVRLSRDADTDVHQKVRDRVLRDVARAGAAGG